VFTLRSGPGRSGETLSDRPPGSVVAVGTDFVLGVDLDGVCADYNESFRHIVAADRGVDPDSLPTRTDWGFDDWGIDTDDFLRLHRSAVVDKRMLRDLPVIDGCAEALWRLSDMGAWIRIITHRLYVNWGHETVVVDTVGWLDEHRVPYRDLCFLGAKPQVEADVYIDDAPHNVEGLRAAGNTVIVFDQSYNRDLDGLRARNWHEVEEIVTELASRKMAVQQQLPGLDAGADRLERRKST
jgi:5'(3')-deoxyribonucleotidase